MKDIEIRYLGLKTIHIPEGVLSVNCSRNFLQSIELPRSLKNFIGNKNLLKEITFKDNNQLEYLDIRSNKFTVLDFIVPKQLICLNATRNNCIIGNNIKDYIYIQNNGVQNNR